MRLGMPGDRSERPADVDPDTPPGPDDDGRAGPRWMTAVTETAGMVVLALLLAFVVKSFLVQAFYIPTGSMIPTLQIHDRVLVEKVTYRFRPPERGEIVVLRRPGAERARAGVRGQVRSFLEGLGLVQPDEDIDLIKRVIGLPGDRIRIRRGVVSVNGQPLTEPYAQPETRSFRPTVVPHGELFLLGDNRMSSSDSRFSDLGTVPIDNVVGRAFVILWPPDRFTTGLDSDYDRVEER